jgi:hypothetical protein
LAFARKSTSKSLALGADDGARTRDPWLGKPMLYQLSYVRLRCPTIPPRPLDSRAAE